MIPTRNSLLYSHLESATKIVHCLAVAAGWLRRRQWQQRMMSSGFRQRARGWHVRNSGLQILSSCKPSRCSISSDGGHPRGACVACANMCTFSAVMSTSSDGDVSLLVVSELVTCQIASNTPGLACCPPFCNVSSQLSRSRPASSTGQRPQCV